MARRATPSTKRQSAARDATPEPQAPRRRGKAKPNDAAEPMLDGLAADGTASNGAAEPTETAEKPAAGRRGRKSRPKTAPDVSAESSAEASPISQAGAEPTPEPPAAPASMPGQEPAARWDASTGTATFDWPSIEQVAAAEGPNQAMARLLLAARAEGANSRWPF